MSRLIDLLHIHVYLGTEVGRGRTYNRTPQVPEYYSVEHIPSQHAYGSVIRLMNDNVLLTPEPHSNE